MTYLGGILSGDKIFKRAFSCTLLLIVLSTLFLSSFALVLAQGGGADSGGAANPPPLPIGGPGTFPIGGNGPGAINIPPGGTVVNGVVLDANGQEIPPVITPEVAPVGQIDNMALRMLHAVFVEGLGWVLGVFGYFFDYAIQNFIVGFGDKYLNSNLGDTIEALWSTVRDIFNLTFIFGLVYIGFKMILDSSDSSARRMLVYLIGAALLVNFSLFITKFIIDLSNIAAFQIYRAFAGDGAVAGFSLTSSFKDLMGVNSILSVKYDDNDYVGFRYIFGIAIVFLVMSYVFLAGAVMITIRFVVLCIYMVFSPLMFLGWVFPAMQGQSAKYWKGFLNQAFFAPAFLFMIYLSYRVAFSYGETRKSWEHVFNNGSAAAADTAPDTIAYFALVMVFLVASLMVARHMGAYGASVAIATGNKLRGNIQSSLGRNTVGRLAGGFGNINDSLEGSRTGRNFKRALSVASLGSLDERARRNIAKAGKEAKFGGSYSRSDDKKLNTELATTQASGKFSSSVKKGVSGAGGVSEQIEFEQAIAGASTPQLIDEIKNYKSDSPEYGRLVQAMSHSQVTKLLESKDEDLSPSKRAALAKIRGEVIKKKVEDGGSLEKGMAKASSDDLVALGYKELSTNAQFIPGSKMDDLKSKLTATEFKELAKTRKTQLEASFANYSTRSSVFNQPGITDKKKDSELARLPDTILTDPGAVPNINVRVLDIILRENLLTSSQRATLKGHIQAQATGSGTAADTMKDWLLSTPAGKGF